MSLPTFFSLHHHYKSLLLSYRFACGIRHIVPPCLLVFTGATKHICSLQLNSFQSKNILLLVHSSHPAAPLEAH